ncbi:MAG: helix-turn-helix domain-containing protein, partial [Candidatus Accumulibacter sp.]|nr:helix-turn-helix domain-containing protein [Accumulibacter sp.]
MSEERAVPDSPAGPERDRGEPAEEEVADVGQCLRLAREARGISVGDAAAALKLSPHQVVALEADDWFLFPRTVSRGFVRNYARYLRIDVAPLMAALDRVPMPHGPELAGIGAAVNMPREGSDDRRNYLPVAAGLIVLVLALLAYFFIPTELWQTGLDSVRGFVSQKKALFEEAVEPAGLSDEAPDTVAAPADTAPPAPTPAEPMAVETVAPEPAAPIPVEAPPTEPIPATPVRVETAPIEAAPVGAAPVGAASLEAVAENTAEKSPAGEMLMFSFDQPSWVEVRDRDGQILLSQI